MKSKAFVLVFVVYLFSSVIILSAQSPDTPPDSGGTAPADPTITPTLEPAATIAPAKPKPRPATTAPTHVTAAPVITPAPVVPEASGGETIPTSSPFKVPAILAVYSLALAGLAGFLKIKKNNKKEGKCEDIKRQLEQKETQLRAVDKELRLKETLIEKVKEDLKESATEKAKNFTKDTILQLEKDGATRKTIELAEKAKETYDDLSEKYEKGKEIIDVLKAKSDGLTKEVQALQKSYKMCMLGGTTKDVASGGLKIPIVGEGMEKLFSYGSLQVPDIQEKLFNRKLSGEADTLAGDEKGAIEIEGKVFNIANVKDEGRIDGVVYELSGEDLERADKYEGEDYKRIKVKLVSGGDSWVYIRK